MLDNNSTECRLKEKINNTAGRSSDLDRLRIEKCSKYIRVCKVTCPSLNSNSTRLSQPKSVLFLAVLGSFEHKCTGACTGTRGPQWTTLPGQAPVGMALGSFQGRWLGGWPSLSSSVSAGCHFSVMEMIFPLNPCPGLQGRGLSAPVKWK